MIGGKLKIYILLISINFYRAYVKLIYILYVDKFK